MITLFQLILVLNLSSIITSNPLNPKEEVPNNNIHKAKIDEIGLDSAKQNPANKLPLVKNDIINPENSGKILSNANLKQDSSNKTVSNSVQDISNGTNKSQHLNEANIVLPKDVPWNKNAQESSFLTKGMMVLLSISLLFMMFVAYKTYRRKSRNARIKKYGVRLTRGNIEMTPLPLDNDDEDETLFDLKNLPT